MRVGIRGSGRGAVRALASTSGLSSSVLRRLFDGGRRRYDALSACHVPDVGMNLALRYVPARSWPRAVWLRLATGVEQETGSQRSR